MSATAASLPNLGPTLGALVTGDMISLILYGFFTLQVYIYFRLFPADSRILRIVVAGTWILETGHIICLCQSLYTTTVIDFFKPQLLAKTPSGLVAALVLGATGDFLVQITYAYRLYRFSGSLIISVFCWTLAVFVLSLNMKLTQAAATTPSIIVYAASHQWLFSTILFGKAVLDITIAGSLCYFLTMQKRGALGRVVQLLNHVIVLTIETGLVTSLGAIAAAICFQTMPDNYVWIGIFTFLPELFANALLASLNGRKLRPTESTVVHLSGVQMTNADVNGTNTYRSIRFADPTQTGTNSSSFMDRSHAFISMNEGIPGPLSKDHIATIISA